jgi:hypothetical protein
LLSSFLLLGILFVDFLFLCWYNLFTLNVSRIETMINEIFDYFTYENKGSEEYPHFILYGWSTYELQSVLAGQPKKVFIDSFESLDDLLKVSPEANGGSKFTDPIVSLNHLPSEDDFVAGGAYPDDYDDGY